MPCGEFATSVGELPKASSEAGRESGALQPVVAPTRSVLVDELDAAGHKFRAVRLTECQRRRSGLVNVTGWCALRVQRQVAQDWFDEPVVRRDRHMRLGA